VGGDAEPEGGEAGAVPAAARAAAISASASACSLLIDLPSWLWTTVGNGLPETDHSSTN
jgi:hypothetical protein